MPPRKAIQKAVTWLSEEISNENNVSNTFHYYRQFKFSSITAELDDFVLVSNADTADPDSEEGCDAAKIITLYEDTANKNNPFRARVQWYSKPNDLPKGCLNNRDDITFLQKEVVEDHRPFDRDVSIETFFKKCQITLASPDDTGIPLEKSYHYICRYRVVPITKRKFNLEPVLEHLREQILQTPQKNQTTKTPSSLVKRMGRVSISDRNWSVSKNDGTRLLLKRAILSDKNEKESPKQLEAKETPNRIKDGNNRLEYILSTELKENSDEEIPTLIIRQHFATTPKRKTPSRQAIEETPKKTLLFEEDKEFSTRSGRKIKHPVTYYESEISPVKRLSRKVSETSDDFPMTPKRPRTPRPPKLSVPKTPRTSMAKTPKSVRRVLTSELTPTLLTRAHSVENINDFTNENPLLPGRESQLEEILSFVRSKLLDKTSGCMYISGVPGAGKTATVNRALKILKEDGDLPEFQLVEVNGMRITEPRQAYVQIYKQLTETTVVWEQACSLLKKRFTNPGPRRKPTVLLVDELDALCNRRQDVLYSIMEWAGHSTALLTVLAVANTMDLPERALAARVTSRLGLSRLTFPPYTHTQLRNIVATKLAGANVTSDAVQLISRKVAAVSGDARRALALCGRALELAGSKQAGLGEVQKALEEAASSATVRAIAHLAPAEKLLLKSVASEVSRTGLDETTLSKALNAATAIVSVTGRPYRCAAHVRPPTFSQAHAICARLAALRLLLLEPKPGDPRLLLNVSVDDVFTGTKNKNEIDSQ